MATTRLQYVPVDMSSGAKPFIVHFTNADLRETGKRSIKFGCFRWADPTDKRKRQRRTLVAESDTMEYVGQNFGQASRSNLLCKYIVGIYNEKTEVMKMYDTEMVTLQPQTLTTGHELEEEQESKMDLSLIEKKDLLTQAFGSNKKKRAVASRLRNRIDSEEVGGSVSGLIENLASDHESVYLNDGIDVQHMMIPPFNPHAETVVDVYKFEDIITPLEYDAMKRSATELQNSNKERIKEWRSQKAFPEYVLQHLEMLSVNPSQRLHQCCCLLYLSFLINMYNLNYKDLRKQDPLPGVPNIIKDRLLSLFSLVKGKARAIPKRLKDKLISYILILALLIDEFSLDFTFIMKDLRMAAPRFQNYVKAVGCVIQSTKIQGKRKFGESEIPSKRAILQVPLPPDFTQAPTR